MVGVSYPRECAGNADSNKDVRDDACNKNRVMIVLVVHEDQNDPKDEPDETRCGAAGVNASYVLQDRCASKAEPERRPLHTTRVK